MKKYYTILSAIALLASCTNNDIPQSIDEKTPLVINSAILANQITSKAGYEFTNNDKMALIINGGIYETEKRATYKFYGNNWIPIDNDNEIFLTPKSVNLKAYVPVGCWNNIDNTKDELSEDIVMNTMEYDNNWETAPMIASNRDIYSFSTYTASSAAKVNIVMSHIHSRLDFNILAEQGFNTTGISISKIELTGEGLCSSRYYNAKTMSWANSIGTTTGITININSCSFGVNGAKASILAVPSNPFMESSQYRLKISLNDNRVYTCPLTLSQDGFATFIPNQRYVFNIKLTPKGLSVVNINRSDWTIENLTPTEPLMPVVTNIQ